MSPARRDNANSYNPAMCGRFVRHSNVHELTRLVMGLQPPAGDEPKPRYNMAPTQTGLVAREYPETNLRELVALKWWLVPHWSKDTKIGSTLD